MQLYFMVPIVHQGVAITDTFDQLGGTQIIRNDGHFGLEGKSQPYTEFPLLRDVILGAG